MGTKTLADDSHFSAGQGAGWSDRLNVRFTVDVLFSQQAIGNAHDYFLPDFFRRFLTAGDGHFVITLLLLLSLSTLLEDQSAAGDA